MMKADVKSMAAGLDAGCSLSGLVCPQCGGGTTRESSFGITRTEVGILYNCHRDSCKYRGFIPTAAWASDFSETKPKKKGKPYERATGQLGVEEREFLKEKFELEDWLIDAAGWKLGLEDGRVIMPVRNVHGRDIGVTARSYDPKTTKKSIAYPNGNNDPWMAWYRFNNGGDTIVLVEDQVSAVKLAQFAPTVALLGTAINDEKAVALSSSFSNVLLWLDADAFSTAFSLQKKYRLMFRNFFVFTGSKTDPKDTSLTTIYNILSSYSLV